MERAPTVVINGKAYDGPTGSVVIGDQKAHVVPLFGVELDNVLAGVAERFAAAESRLPAVENSGGTPTGEDL